MTSRDRVLAALRHEPTDQVPIDLGGHRSSGIMAIAYGRLKQALGIRSGHVYVYDMLQQLAIVEPEVLDLFDVDVVEMGRGFMTADRDWKDWTLPDGTPCKVPGYVNLGREKGDWYLYASDGTPLAVQKAGSLYFEQIHFPLMDRGIEDDDFADLPQMCAKTMWAGVVHPGAHFPLDDAGVARLAAGARALRESTSRAIVGLFGANLFELPQWLYRMDNYLTYLALHPEAVHRLTEALATMYLRNLERWLGAVGPHIDIILFGDDLGAQGAPLLSPTMYREFFKPWHRRLWLRAKQIAPVKVMLHSCGAIAPLLDDLIDAGLDAVNPVQVTCPDMDPGSLRRVCRNRLCMWGGGCDTRHVLPRARPAEVAAHVHDQIAGFGPGGGFVFQQVHNIMADVPPANIIAMLAAARAYRF